MTAIHMILRGASLAGLLMIATALGGWGRSAGIISVPDQDFAAPLMLVKDEPAAGLGVNAFLWRASLATLSFMPLATIDPVGGVIITDWYANPQAPNERFKMIVYILDKRLRADGVKVAVFRQVRNAQNWVDATTDPETGTKLENAILTRARQFKVDADQ